VAFKTSISGDLIRFVGYAFVDGTDICQTGQDEITTGEEVATQMQGAMDAWKGGMRATGVAIVPEKSYWYLIDFVSTEGNWSYTSEEEYPAAISVRDLIWQRHVLDRMSPSEARRTLGVRLAPDGNEIAEFNYLRSVAEEWWDKARAGHLSRSAAWLNLTTTVLKTLQYPLAATKFTEKQCTAIMAPVLEAGLPTSGICRTFPRDLVYGPLKYQGLALPNLYTVHGIEHILTVVKFGHCKHENPDRV
jgi:hypothetical protein